MELLDSCNGLLLLLCTRASRPPPPSSGQQAPSKYFYVVCNPATEEWDELPEPRHAPGTCCVRSGHHDGRLRSTRAPDLSGLRPGRVPLELPRGPAGGAGRAGAGQLRHRGGGDLLVGKQEVAGFFRTSSGPPHETARQPTSTALPDGRSRERMLYVHTMPGSPSLSVYALDPRRHRGDAGRWTLVHCACAADRFGETMFTRRYYNVAAIHPHGNVTFLFDTEPNGGWWWPMIWIGGPVLRLAQVSHHYQQDNHTSLYYTRVVLFLPLNFY